MSTSENSECSESSEFSDYILVVTVFGFKFPIGPLSVPTAGSMTQLMSEGFFEASAAVRAVRTSSGVVTWYATPPKAYIILS